MPKRRRRTSKRTRPRNPSIKRLSVRLPEDLYNNLKAHAHNDSYSMNEVVQQACQHYLDWIHNDYDIPSLDRRRVNQLVDAIKALENTDGTKLDAIMRMLAVLLKFTHGENYYSDHPGPSNSNS